MLESRPGNFIDIQPGGTRGLYYNKVMFEAIVPYREAKDGVLTRLVLMPVEPGFGKPRSQGGWPRPDYASGILKRLAKMSKPYGTEIDIVDGPGIVKL